MKSVTHEFYRLKRTSTTNRRCWTETCLKDISKTDESQEHKKDKKKKQRPKTAKEDSVNQQYPYTSTCFEIFIFPE